MKGLLFLLLSFLVVACNNDNGNDSPQNPAFPRPHRPVRVPLLALAMGSLFFQVGLGLIDLRHFISLFGVHILWA